MRNVSLVLLSVSLSSHFSAHSMLRSVRSRTTVLAQNGVEKVKRNCSQEEKRSCLESLHRVKWDLDIRENELRDKLDHIKMLEGRFILVRSYLASEATKRKQIEDLIEGRGSRIDWGNKWLPSTPSFESAVYGGYIDTPLSAILEREPKKLKMYQEMVQNELDLVREHKDRWAKLMVEENERD